MAIPFHTHSFDLPIATKQDILAGVSTDKVVVPSNLGSAALEDSSAFATAEQGKKADNALSAQRRINVGEGLVGGGDLTADRTIEFDEETRGALKRAKQALLHNDLDKLAFKDKIDVQDIKASGIAKQSTVLAGNGEWIDYQAGGMASEIYDPRGLARDVFDMANMVETGNAKILTASERQLINNGASQLKSVQATLTEQTKKLNDQQLNISLNSAARHNHLNIAVLEQLSSNNDERLLWKTFPLAKQADLRPLHENLIINGGFTVNQRNANKKPAIGEYGFDRWKGHDWGLEQVVENLPQGKYTLTWTGGGKGSLNWIKTGTSPLVAELQAGDADIVVPANATNVSLVYGEVTEYDPFRPRLYSDELQLCQRYFLNFGDLDGYQSYYWVLFPIPGILQKMRLFPVITSGALIDVNEGKVQVQTPEIHVDNNVLYVHNTSETAFPVMAWLKLKTVTFDADF